MEYLFLVWRLLRIKDLEKCSHSLLLQFFGLCDGIKEMKFDWIFFLFKKSNLRRNVWITAKLVSRELKRHVGAGKKLYSSSWLFPIYMKRNWGKPYVLPWLKREKNLIFMPLKGTTASLNTAKKIKGQSCILYVMSQFKGVGLELFVYFSLF